MKNNLKNILFNGKKYQTDKMDSASFFVSQICKQNSKQDGEWQDSVWIVNGFATKEPKMLENGDELWCIKKGEMPPQDALESMMSARHTPKVHNALKQSKVAICGLGGLGSHIAIMLARSGLGHLVLIDFDIIEPSNLNRQAYNIDDLGKPKTQALQAHIKAINPFITTQIFTQKIESSNIKSFFNGCQIVCEAFDNPYAKAMLAQHFHAHFPDSVLICASGLAGFGESNAIKTHKINDRFYVCGDLSSAAGYGRGLMSPRVNICAAHQANLVLELLCAKNGIENTQK